MDAAPRPKLHVEIRKCRSSQWSTHRVVEAVQQHLDTLRSISTDSLLSDLPIDLCAHVERVRVCEVEGHPERKHVEPSTVQPQCHIYTVETFGPSTEELGVGMDTGEGDSCSIPAATHWVLPAVEFEGMWEALVYDSMIKEQLMKYVEASLVFSDRGTDRVVVPWNKVVLLHGPPALGKTSLCKALAQKLSVRLDSRYKYAQLVEINSHSLFSKWFSESGKLVQKMFGKIVELIEDPAALVVVLIDEVESLARARQSSMSGADPSDAVRVVNAVLTQLDYINRFPNVVIFTTSNISGTLDLAFVDRADIKEYIGFPSRAAVYMIYLSCVAELQRTGILADSETLFSYRELETMNMIVNEATKLSMKLLEIAGKSEGLSGRTLRKLTFLAYAIHCPCPALHLPLHQYLHALHSAVDKHHRDLDTLGGTK
ncbi:pachytene checkpoint protein 2 homolog [Portunus trituberculatus]|uniref:pachytene checkpoint protein 2 homolog n=1 Tax=Portunus trituberculatus TaxID=210409 RepID=UPI001E1CF0D3|nr:pachytene checkpoint protein 2 homolog [Portunus trituberculatus]